MSANPGDRGGSSAKADQPASAPSVVEIVNVIRPHVEKIEEGFKAIRVTLDALAEHLGGAAPVRGETPAPVEKRVDEPPKAQPVAQPARSETEAPAAAEPPVAAPVEPARAPKVETPPTAPPEPAPVKAPPPEPVPAPEPPKARPVAKPTAIRVSGGGDGGNWSQIVFGEQLSVDPAVSYLSGTLISDVHAGDNDAVGLMGHLMDFRSAALERKPKMLKDIGESFYRWKPTDDATLRDALIVWLHAVLDSIEIGNRIAIVQVGDRYDMQRHNAKERGVEVSDVFGWIVLRENGKVYSKASVSVG